MPSPSPTTPRLAPALAAPHAVPGTAPPGASSRLFPQFLNAIAGNPAESLAQPGFGPDRTQPDSAAISGVARR